MNKIMRNKWSLLAIIGIVFLGFVSYLLISSRNVERMLFDWLGDVVHSENMVSSPDGEKDPANLIKLPLDFVEIGTRPKNGAFNHYSDRDTIADVAERSVWIAVGLRSDILGWNIPFPFLVPFAVHLGVVWVMPMVSRLGLSQKTYCRFDHSFSSRALRAVLYAYVVAMFFQSSRMFWGSSAWDLKYFVSYEYGWSAFNLFLGLCVAMYLYCVIGTAGLQVRRKPTAKKQTCIKCGYGTAGLDRCPECDLEVGAFIDSKWRINHWHLAGMFVVTFFSPVLVASVYSVLR